MIPEFFRRPVWMPPATLASRSVSRMAQASFISPQEREAASLLDEARSQLRQVQQNFSSLVASLGHKDAQQALQQANMSVSLYEEQLKNARALT